MNLAVRSPATQAVVDRYDAVRALLDRVWAAGPADRECTELARPLLEHEARLLDTGRHDDWIALYDAGAVLWIPAHPDDHPGRDQALAFDDLRRMRERARHMGDPRAWAITAPRPMTTRHLGPVAAWPDGDGVLATSTLTVALVRRGPEQVLHGREVLRLAGPAGALRITAKILVFPGLTLGGPHIGWVM